MYTVVVADDEPTLRCAIVEKVDWNSIGFQVAAQAENGALALEMVEKYEPDLLITDIKMPFISGIDLARQVREIRPSTNIAFLSGYDDFSYARQAIQYNIISYLLKPISLDELTLELKVIKQKMDEKNMLFKHANDNSANYAANYLMPLLLDTDISYDASNLHQIKLQAVKYGLLRDTNDNPKYTVLVFRLEDRRRVSCAEPAHVNSINSILKKYVRYSSIFSNGKIISLIAENSWELSEYLHILVTDVIQSIERMLHLQCYIGVSREYDDITHSSYAYAEAINALGYSHDGNGSVHYISDMERNSNFDYDFINDKTAELENHLKVGEKNDIQPLLDNLFDEISAKKATKSELDFAVIQIIGCVIKALTAVSDGSVTNDFFSAAGITSNMFSFRNIDTLKNDMTQFCLSAKDAILNQRRLNSEIICDNALEIINHEYGNDELSLVALSERLHISSNYLSALIKKNSGKTFIELLTQKRMHAAYDLIMGSSMKVREVADKCGYADQHYFSYCFKKYHGMSPNKIREKQAQS